MSSMTFFAGDSDLDMVTVPGSKKWRRIALGTSAVLVCGVAAAALCYSSPSSHALGVGGRQAAAAQGSSANTVTLTGGDLTRLFLEVSGSPDDSHAAIDAVGKALVGDSDASVFSGNDDGYFDELLSGRSSKERYDEEDAFAAEEPVVLPGLQQKVAVTAQVSDSEEPAHKLPSGKGQLPCPHKAVGKLFLAFGEADADHDGLLKGKEMQTILGSMQDALDLDPKRFEQLSANITGSASTWDFPDVRNLAASLYLFKLADKDKNNLLSADELKFKGTLWAGHFAAGPVPPAKWQQLWKKANWTDGQLDAAALGDLLAVAWGSVLSPPMAMLWKRMDADRSGELEGAELVALGVELRSRFMLRARDYEGLVTTDHMDQTAFKHLFLQAHSRSPLAKLPPPVAKFFASVDKDRSGSVAHAELVLFKTMVMQKLSMKGPPVDKLVKEADKDSNGELSVEEFGDCVTEAWKSSPFAEMSPQTTSLFHWADKDHDLVLDGPELEPMAGALHKVLRQPREKVERELELGAGSDSKLAPQELKKVLATLEQ